MCVNCGTGLGWVSSNSHYYMELGSYFLFLQEQIKDIIIIIQFDIVR
jgi:hypothetical protein